MTKNATNLKTLVRASYDLQKLRIQLGNRIVANFKAKLGQEPGERESVIDAEGQLILKGLRKSYKKLTDGVKTFPRHATFKGDGVIDDYGELLMIDSYVRMEQQEHDLVTRLAKIVGEFEIWLDFLEGVKGCGPLMAAVIISEFDITRAPYPSSLWKYAGLDVGQDGAGRSRRTEHLTEWTYTNADGEEKTRKGITFNPFLKTKLIGVLGGCLLKAADPTYSTIYRDHKLRLENHAVYGIANEETRKAEMKANNPKSKYSPKAHRHNMAMRYMVKQFLVDLHTHWRKIEGLPVSLPYAEAKLGLMHAN